MRRLLMAIPALLIGLSACDDSNDNPVRTETVEVDKPNVVYDTTVAKKTVILAKGAVYDTVRTKFQNNSIIGSLISNGTTSVVCSEYMNRCAKTNSKGIYQISLPVRPLLAGRIYAELDTVTTPENVDIFFGDTIVTPLGKDTTVVSDTNVSKSVKIVGNDTLVLVNIEQIDTIKSADSIKVEISEPSPVAVADTLTVVANGSIISQLPINSWGRILDSGFIDKWSVEVYDNTFDHSLKSIEFVYFTAGDSIAQVVSLGRAMVGGEFTNRFSGPFFYYWDDSAYSKGKFIHNYFIRGKDSDGNVICRTAIETFSAKAIPAKTIYLENKIGLPQHMIQPKFVPAATNNKKMNEAVLEYSVDTTKNWVGIDNLAFRYLVVDTALNTQYILDTNNATVIRFCRSLIPSIIGTSVSISTKPINFDSLRIVSCSFTIKTEADTIVAGFSAKNVGNFIQNTSTEYKIDLTKNVGDFMIGGWKGGEYILSKITNIRFHFKPE